MCLPFEDGSVSHAYGNYNLFKFEYVVTVTRERPTDDTNTSKGDARQHQQSLPIIAFQARIDSHRSSNGVRRIKLGAIKQYISYRVSIKECLTHNFYRPSIT